MTDDMNQKLLALMANSKGTNGVPTETMMSELFGNDPRAALIAQYLNKSQTEVEEEDDLILDTDDDLLEQVPEEEHESFTSEQAPADEYTLAQLFHIIEELKAENEEINELLDTLAAALGACHRCWGGLEACRICKGWGQPGWQLPEGKLFKELIVPSIQRWRKAVGGARHPPPARKPTRLSVDNEHFSTRRTKP